MNKTPFLADNVRKMIHHSGVLYLEIFLRATSSYLRDNVYFGIKTFQLHLIFTKLNAAESKVTINLQFSNFEQIILR